MAMNQPYQAYKQNSVNTASPGELTLLLYNGCLKFIKLAKMGIENNNIEQRHINLVKAQNVINELMITLDMNVEISKSIMQMYDYINRRLIEANTKNSIEILDEVEGFVSEFRDTWKEAIRLAKKPQMAESGQA
ncbi:flagellar export chaperone FliS [Bacillus sp. S/N-304-OC-R1]|uniref:flagellar export chaperone FliS n=1 Tax=Bacillus sp. S/N-304-OC-R1 TaxID=2758034 RepID=UPI001C8DF1D1|nr:flagellar export chaperone FliS [Bacillus sp. S/N-304-OC-R1]MBY0123445.1 flagellar export chaperone FliS [Bacillus sp. S/N-304-OC-R1]